MPTIIFGLWLRAGAFTALFIGAVIVFTSIQARPLRAQAGDVIDDPETYAVYGAAVAQLKRAGDQAPTRIAVLRETRPGLTCRGEGLEPEWREVLARHAKENARVRVIQAGFDLGVPYSVVPLSDIRKRMQDAGYDLSKFSGEQSPGAQVFARLPGGRLVAFSAVGFNPEKTRAIVTVMYNCFPAPVPRADKTGRCHEEQQKLMKKEQGRWVTAYDGCTSIA